MDKKKLAVITIIVSIAILIIGVISFSNNNNSNNTNPSSTPQPSVKAKITYFDLNGYDNPVGIIWNVKFIVRILNNGTTEAKNMTLTFNTNSTYIMDRQVAIFGSQGNYAYDINMSQPYALDILKVGEVKEVDGEIWNNLLDDFKIRGFAFTVSLKYEEFLVDEASVIIP